MQGRSSLVVLLVFTLSAVAFGLRRKYYIVKDHKTWEEAQKYCRKTYTDLAVISNSEEEDRFNAVRSSVISRGQPFPQPDTQARSSETKDVWIGLHTDNSTTGWKWSGGYESSYRPTGYQLSTTYLPGSSNTMCVGVLQRGWVAGNCDKETKRWFVCFDQALVLVRENKTWEEALVHCRDNYTDLASLLSLERNKEAQVLIKEAQTDHVWTGLRYLAGSWLWVKKGDLLEHQSWEEGKQPLCPAWSDHCGTLPREGPPHWGTRDCETRMNFLCI